MNCLTLPIFILLLLGTFRYGPALLLMLADIIAPNDPYTNGWNWVVTSIEDGIEDDVITEVIENGKMFEPAHLFDKGAEDALRHYLKHGVVNRK